MTWTRIRMWTRRTRERTKWWKSGMQRRRRGRKRKNCRNPQLPKGAPRVRDDPVEHPIGPGTAAEHRPDSIYPVCEGDPSDLATFFLRLPGHFPWKQVADAPVEECCKVQPAGRSGP